jgi:hypothetical protein
MLVSEIQTQVKNIFGDTAQAQITDAMILDWINNGQMDICRKSECLEAPYTANLVAGTDQYAYPADFIKEQRLMVNGIKMVRLTLSSIDMLFPDRLSAPMQSSTLYYFHWQRKFNLYPVPPASVTGGLVVWYVRYAATLTAPGNTPEIPTMFHEDLVRFCLWHAWEQDQEWGAAQQAKQDYDTRLLKTIYDSQVEESESYPAVQLCAGDG